MPNKLALLALRSGRLARLDATRDFRHGLLAAGQATAAGEWQMSFVSPNGPQELTMYLTQEGPRLSGHISSEFGEYIVKGSLDKDDVKLSWSVYEQGKEVLFSVTGKLDGESITGTIKLGNVGTGPFRAERTAGA